MFPDPVQRLTEERLLMSSKLGSIREQWGGQEAELGHTHTHTGDVQSWNFYVSTLKIEQRASMS